MLPDKARVQIRNAALRGAAAARFEYVKDASARPHRAMWGMIGRLMNQTCLIYAFLDSLPELFWIAHIG